MREYIDIGKELFSKIETNESKINLYFARFIS